MQVPVLPAGPAAAGPGAQLAVLEEVLVALGREARERFGALADLETARQQSQRALVDLRRRELQVGVAPARLVGHAGRRRIAEVGVFGAHHGGDHLARAGAAVAGEAADRRVRALEPRGAHEAHAGEPEEHLRVGAARGRRVRRDDRDPQALDLAQVDEPLLDRVRAKRNAVQPPPGGPIGPAGRVLHGDHAPVAHVEPLVADREHEPHEALRHADPGHRVELEVAVQVLGVHEAVVAAAAGPEVAEEEGLERAVLRGAAQRQRVEPHPGGRVDDAVGHAVREDALVVDRRVPRLGHGVALRVEPAQAHVALPVEHRVATRGGGGVREVLRHPRERVLEHGSEIEEHGRVVVQRHAVVVLPHPDLEVFDPRQVDAGRRERLGDGAPAGAILVRPHPVGVARPHVGEAQHSVGLEGEPQDGLGRLRLAHQPDLRVDLLRQELDRSPIGVQRPVLPGERDRVRGIEARRGGDAERLRAAHRGGNAAPVPAVLGERDEAAGLGLELLDVGLAELVRGRPRHGDLGGHVQERGSVAVDAGEGVHRPRQELRLEVQLGGDAADEARRRLEAERGAGEGALLLLEQARQRHVAARAQVVARREPVDGRGRHRERGALLELRPHLRRAALEQRVRVLELHLPGGIVDGVVHIAREQPAAHGDPLAAVADLEAVERQGAAVGGRGDVGVQVEREHRRRALREEQRARRAVQRVIALRSREARGVGERLQVREHDEVVAQRRALLRIAGAGEQAVVLVELRGIRLERQAQPGEIGVPRQHGALALVHGERQLHRLAHDLAPAHAVGAADLEPERGRRGRDAELRVVDEPQRVHHGRVLSRAHGERAYAALSGTAPDRPGGNVGHGEVVVLVEAAREGEPRAAPIHVVVFALLQDFPQERARPLAAAVHRPGRSRTARHRPHPADVLVPARERRERAHPVHVQAGDAQRVGERRGVERQYVHRGRAGDEHRVYREEEPPHFVIEIPRHAVERLRRGLAHGVHAIFDHVALLLGEDTAQLEGPELPDRLHAEVVRRNARADEARRRHLKRDVADLDPPQRLVFEAFVPDLEVVVRVELALAVEVDVQVQAPSDDAARADRVLRHRTDRGESRLATRQRQLLLERRALEVLELVAAELEAQPQVHPDLRAER